MSVLLKFMQRCFAGAVLVIMTSCAGTEESPELERLERPPLIIDFSSSEQIGAGQSAAIVPQEEQQTEAENEAIPTIQLAEQSGSDTRITILEPFDEAWLMVTQALNQDAFEITDKDRDQGLIYVNFDPSAENSSVWGSTLDFFTGGDPAQGEYRLKLLENGMEIDVTAEMLITESFDDEDDDYSNPEVGVEEFLLKLYEQLQEN